MNKKLEKVMREKARLYLTEGRGVNISDLSEEIKSVIFKDGYKKAIESAEVQGLLETLNYYAYDKYHNDFNQEPARKALKPFEEGCLMPETEVDWNKWEQIEKDEMVKDLERKDLIKNPHVKELVEDLEFYAKQKHFVGDWDTVSGEAQNLLCLNGTDEWHWIESGLVAQEALKKWEGERDEKRKS